MENYYSLIVMVLFFVALYFILIRPQKKREKQVQEMLRAMRVGDEVLTGSGIVGKLVEIKEDEVVIETSIDRTKIALKKAAIQSVIVNETETKEETSDKNNK